jgi:hypothetical protein
MKPESPWVHRLAVVTLVAEGVHAAHSSGDEARPHTHNEIVFPPIPPGISIAAVGTGIHGALIQRTQNVVR